MRTAVFTIIAPNRRHYARVLMASLAIHEPAWDRHVLVVGGNATPETDDFAVVAVGTLRLPRPAAFAFRYTILELSTAVKPWMFAHLFGRGYDRVVYLDPDTQLFTSLAELDAVPADTLLLLTPHLTAPIDNDGHPSERTLLQSGAYNLGFLAAWRHPSLDAFLGWWQRRLEHGCVAAVERGLFVDQKWMDLTPGLFPGVHVLRHDGWNVAYWNLRQRTVRQGADGGYQVNGVPLRFFHFSGVEPAPAGHVSRHDGRLRLADVGAARGLVEAYREELRARGQAACEDAPYAFARFKDGTPIADAARAAYRDSSALQDACGDDPFAHPGRFSGIRDTGRDPRATHLAASAYRVLTRPRGLIAWLPRPVRAAARQFLLGPDPPRG